MPLVTLESFRNSVQAELARSQLESAGIPAVVLDENLASIQWLYSDAIGGVKLKVDEAHREEAESFLAGDHSEAISAFPENLLSPSGGDECPSCSSRAVRRSRLQRIAGGLSLLTGLPLIAWHRRWVCESCGHSWLSRPGPTQVAPATAVAEIAVHQRRSYPVFFVCLLVLIALAVLRLVEIQSEAPF